MGPAYFVIAILGCADGGTSCTQVATLQKGVSGLSGLSTDIFALKGQISGLQSEINSLEAQITAIQNQISG